MKQRTKELTQKHINRIRKNPDNQNWERISLKYKLSESFIKEFQNYIDWFGISMCQKLSESFILEFKDKIDWRCIETFQNIDSFSDEFRKELLIRRLKL